jgi:hypothetical protein
MSDLSYDALTTFDGSEADPFVGEADVALLPSWVTRGERQWTLPIRKVTSFRRNRLVRWRLDDVLFTGDSLVLDERIQGWIGVALHVPFEERRSPRAEGHVIPHVVYATIKGATRCPRCRMRTMRRFSVVQARRRPKLIATCTRCAHVRPA